MCGHWHSDGLLDALTASTARALVDTAAHPSGPLLQLRGIGGAVNDVDAAETAYAHRHQEVLATVPTFPPSAGDELDEAFRHLEPHVDGVYQNFESRPDERSGGSASRCPAWSRRGRDDRSWTAVQD